AGAAGTGGRFAIVPGDAEQSLLVQRMRSTDAALMMPERGRSLIDTEGLMLISQWINTMHGTCAPRVAIQ
ncbi:MAG: hypothetical protein MJA84_05770, partial [Firmicutes bacterium]|nr:hypothetical protein [Bacillota bacterium]